MHLQELALYVSKKESVMLHVDVTAQEPLYHQIYRQIREGILHGKLAANTLLLSTRAQAKHLGVARNTVENAYAQLALEGYITPRRGAGFVVNRIDTTMHLKESTAVPPCAPVPQAHEGPCQYDFNYSTINAATFPYRLWGTLVENVLSTIKNAPMHDPKMHAYGDVRGEIILREQVAAYLYRSRGVQCSPEQVVICSGLQPTLTQLTRILPAGNRTIALEEPGYIGVRVVFQGHGFAVQPVPIEHDGISVQALQRSKAQVVHITPSHQFPMGFVMSIQKRWELLRWANEIDGIILENDYGSEFRYTGNPIPSLQSIDNHQRVIYIGTFSKALSPGLRMSYMVLPPRLVNNYLRSFQGYKCPVSRLEQKVMSHFIAGEHYERHIRRMHVFHKKKRDKLLHAVQATFGSQVDIFGQGAGLHLLLQFATANEEATRIAQAKASGVRVYPASLCWLQPETCPHTNLLLGYGLIDENDIAPAVEKLAQAWQK